MKIIESYIPTSSSDLYYWEPPLIYRTSLGNTKYLKIFGWRAQSFTNNEPAGLIRLCTLYIACRKYLENHI